MSCGKHHDVDCNEILDRVYVFIDHELDNASSEQIQTHLDECGPCLREVDLERLVKALVARSCTRARPRRAAPAGDVLDPSGPDRDQPRSRPRLTAPHTSKDPTLTLL